MTCQHDCYNRKEIETTKMTPLTSQRSYTTEGAVKKKKTKKVEKVIEEDTSLRNCKEAGSLLAATFQMD